LENSLISTCPERGNRDGAIKNYLKDGPQKPSYSFNDVTYKEWDYTFTEVGDFRLKQRRLVFKMQGTPRDLFAI
jgi:hypothetical protein